MEKIENRIRDMSLKRAFFWLTFWCMCFGVILSIAAFMGCSALNAGQERTAVIRMADGSVRMETVRESGQGAVSGALGILQIALPIVLMLAAVLTADWLFYRIKLKTPIRALSDGAEQIMENRLDFHIDVRAGDELGALCGVFERMREQLEKTARELWRQNEEYRRLNAAFSHDLRNPLTVLKGTVKMLIGDAEDGGISREELSETLLLIRAHVRRIERYVEAMSSVQRLSSLPLDCRKVPFQEMRKELGAAAEILLGGVCWELSADAGEEELYLDREFFMRIAENLLGNAGRFAEKKVWLALSCADGFLELTVEDDGCGFPRKLLEKGVLPFGKGEEDGEHFGMGLYICSVLAEKHGGCLKIGNRTPRGARCTVRLGIEKEKSLSVF